MSTPVTPKTVRVKAEAYDQESAIAQWAKRRNN
jgi:hypothetical protein